MGVECRRRVVAVAVAAATTGLRRSAGAPLAVPGRAKSAARAKQAPLGSVGGEPREGLREALSVGNRGRRSILADPVKRGETVEISGAEGKVAEFVPFLRTKRRLGALAGQSVLLGDVEAPTSEPWEAMQE